MSNSPKLSMRELADAAFEQVAKKVIERAKQTGTPIITCENGKVVRLDPYTMKPMLDEPQK